MRHIKDSRAGDLIQDSLGGKCMVLGRLNSLIFRSEFYRYDIAAFHFMTVHQAEIEGWKLLTPDGREEMTSEELERLMPNVKIITKTKK